DWDGVFVVFDHDADVVHPLDCHRVSFLSNHSLHCAVDRHHPAFPPPNLDSVALNRLKVYVLATRFEEGSLLPRQFVPTETSQSKVNLQSPARARLCRCSASL